MTAPNYEFLNTAGRILNSGQARSITLTGDIDDLYFLEESGNAGRYVPLVPFLTAHWDLPGRIVVVYELNGPIRFLRDEHRGRLKDAWVALRTGLDVDQQAIARMLRPSTSETLDTLDASFEGNLQRAIGRPTLALEMLRQMCLCSRTVVAGEPLLREDLIIVIEAADLLIPEAPITQMSDADRHRVAICQDWFSDPGYLDGGDAVILLSESRGQLHHRINQLPHVLEVATQSADQTTRQHYVSWFDDQQPTTHKLTLSMGREEFVELTAGLSIYALSQLVKGASHEGVTLTPTEVVAKVEAYVQSQLGEDIVEFKKPGHALEDVVGFSQLKEFVRDELIPRFQSSGPDALPGAAICGPIGSGKTFIFEAVAGELEMVVLVLKNIRSQWFGQTDVILERLKRVLQALAKVVIFVDEADTQFGGVGPGAHSTERRLTGKIQAMMSDPQLRGRVIWLLMTARINALSPDIRRPGRTGDLIIPVLDPAGEDRDAFLRWVVGAVVDEELDASAFDRLRELTADYSAASFASLRSELQARAVRETLDLDRILEIVDDLIPPAIQQTRRYQTLQALVNCTRRSLLPDPKVDRAARQRWAEELRELERQGLT
jgi:SpoVK/Ycf46/Vps4 family AAA+-type ATPase